LDTDHPVFQVGAVEPEDSIFDVLLERIAHRWARMRDLERRDALAVVREESMKMFTTRADEGGAEPRHIIAILAHIQDSATPLAELDAVCYCYGLVGRSEESMTAIATRHRISRQAFSKKIEKVCMDFRIQPRGGMRPTAQKAIYKDVQRARWAVIDQDAPNIP